MIDMKTLGSLYLTFMKIGGFTLGGGYAMLPIIQHEAVDNKKWVTDEEMTNYMALAQSVPGVIGINTATLVGHRVAGIPGGIAATLGMITPSIVIIILIAAFFTQFQSWEYVQKAFKGVRAAVVALILSAVIRLAKSSVKKLPQIIIMATAATAIIFFNVSPPIMILIGALCGLLVAGRVDA